MDYPRVYLVLHQVVHVVIRKYLLFFGFVTVRVDAAQVRRANPLSTGANAAIRDVVLQFKECVIQKSFHDCDNKESQNCQLEI